VVVMATRLREDARVCAHVFGSAIEISMVGGF
jgi:hypothetical protein